MKKKFIHIMLICCLALGCAAVSGCSKSTGGEKMPQNVSSAETAGDEAGIAESGDEGTQASASEEAQPYIISFEATTTEGATVTSDIFADSKLTMINVWATYCNPCLSEMPDLGAIATEYDKADFQMIGVVSDVMSDAAQEDIDYANELIAETGAVTYDHLFLNESLYLSFVGAVEAVPTTFFVNQKGELLGYLMGAQAKVTWTSLIDDLLAELD